MAKAKTKPEEVQAPTKQKRLNAMDLQLKESVQAQYTALVPSGTTRDDILDPAFWAHCAAQLQSMTEITVIPKDGEWYGRYFVRYSDRTSARLAELEFVKLAAVTADDMANDQFSVDFTTAEKFRVIRTADNVVLQKNFVSQEAAYEWMAEHMKAMAA